MTDNYERVIAKDVCGSAELTEQEQQCIRECYERMRKRYKNRLIIGYAELAAGLLLVLVGILLSVGFFCIFLVVVLAVQAHREIMIGRKYSRMLCSYHGGFKGTVVQKDFQIENSELYLRVVPHYKYRLTLKVGSGQAVDNVLCDEKRIYETAAKDKQMLAFCCADGSVFACNK